MLETPRMRTLKLHFPNDALSPLDAFVQQTKEARGCHRAQAVRAVVKGQRLPTVSDTLQLTYSALRTWVYRFATQGTPGLVDRPRPGRPPTVTCARAPSLHRLGDQDPVPHGALSAPWRGRALAPVLAQQPGGQLGRESLRTLCKKTT
jgi:transposase